MDKTRLLTIVIPVRIDYPERLANLHVVISSLLSWTESPIIILEGDIQSRIQGLDSSERVSIHFCRDEDPIFHRTKYINQLLNLAQTPFVGIWDTDVVLPLEGIVEAIAQVEEGAVMSLPYDGTFLFLSEATSKKARRDPESLFREEDCRALESTCLARPSVGGAYIVDRELYLQLGGENEHFYGWGPEDAERVKRVENLGGKVSRSQRALYHLYHPRGVNSILGEDERAITNLNEFSKVCSMTSSELRTYVDAYLCPTSCEVPTSRGKKKLLLVGNKEMDYKEADSFDYVMRINRMTNYGRTGLKTNALFLEANEVFKCICTGEMLKEKINEETHILMNPYWYGQFREWNDYLTPRQYAYTELIDYPLIQEIVGCEHPTSGVTVLAHLLSSCWSEQYDIYITGFEVEDRVKMIDEDPYCMFHHGAGEAERKYLENATSTGRIYLASIP